MSGIEMLDEIQIDDAPKKSLVESIKCRTEGNNMFFGRRRHTKKVHLEVLSLYNKSVALAENDSEELALAIYNRSVLLMHLNMYKESLIDLKKSLQITKSDELKNKLLAQEMECLSLMDESEKKKVLPVIKKVSKTIPCAADCVSITYDKNYGRCVVATKDIKPGTIISIEKGFVLLPKREKTYTNCSHCLMLACNGMPCNSCAAVIYCSEQCKEEAWLQYHDMECLILPYLRHVDNRNENLTIFLCAIRLFLKLIKKEGLENIVLETRKIRMNKAKDEFLSGFFEDGIFQSDKFSSFYNLSHNVNTALLKRDKIYHYAIIKKIINFLAEKTDVFKNYNEIVNDNEKSSFDFIVQVLYELNVMVGLNGHTFAESYCYCERPMSCQFACGNRRIGDFIAPFSCLLNHSCDQNTCKLFTNNQELLFIAVQSIKKGEQIFTNYGVVLQTPAKSRQNQLMEDFNFTCKCTPCINNLPPDLSILHRSSDIDNLKATFKKVGINQKSLKVFCGAIQIASFDETTIKDFIKMCRIIEKNFNSIQACAYLVSIKDYIVLYFNKLYNVVIFDIPNCY